MGAAAAAAGGAVTGPPPVGPVGHTTGVSVEGDAGPGGVAPADGASAARTTPVREVTRSAAAIGFSKWLRSVRAPKRIRSAGRSPDLLTDPRGRTQIEMRLPVGAFIVRA